ncbi:SMP-30/gluconolactonase/LRE family protein [uncultured Microbacterium sp.]|uniref:Gluconolactonase n=1 Tax=uncultured Microbacterium sp. TaxID=191216 RepID=A0A1Y5P0W6_9MICO|nr:SMP-30/gluconolactonase/LRE family protein [uncultured Microbacterium sp.]SBS72303.1 Gluconolactonase [uncultured Microbacterium sp.]
MRLLETAPYVLAEGPVWDPSTRRLSWVDIDDGRVMSAILDADGSLGDVTTLQVGGQVGAAIPAGGGRFLVSLEAWIGILHPDGSIDKSRALIPTNRRFNDGKIDPQGRFVVGSIRRFGGVDGRQHLLRLEHDGSITVLDDTLNMSNGLGWSPDGEWLYYAESHDRLVYRRSYIGGVAGPRDTFLRLDGLPDGMTVDADGRLWVTQLDLGRIDCFAPDGSRLEERTIALDAAHPTSVEFAGPDLDVLVITTGFPWLDGDVGVTRSDGDGRLLTLRLPGVRGLAPTAWREAPLPR